MKAALAAMVLAGAAIGLLIPGERSASSTAATVAPSTAGQPGSAETRLARAPSGHFHAKALVNGHPVDFVVDTGATSVALTMADARLIGIPFERESFTVVGTGASGPVMGQQIIIDSVDVDGKEVRRVRGVVLEGLEISLLGDAYLSRISGVEMRGDEMILR